VLEHGDSGAVRVDARSKLAGMTHGMFATIRNQLSFMRDTIAAGRRPTTGSGGAGPRSEDE
jgi:hypothetical protein